MSSTSPPRPAARPDPLILPDGAPARDLWSLDRRLRHLNHGSYGAVPRPVQEAQTALRAEMLDSPSVWFAGLPERLATARGRVAAQLGVDQRRLAFVPNASGGASAVLGSLHLEPGAEILVTDHGYGAVVTGVERFARRHGGVVRTVHVPLAAQEQEAAGLVADAFTAATRLLVIDQITSPTARMLPVPSLVERAREAGVLTLVDGAHAPGILPRPVGDPAPDFWVGNLHKWACAPPGSAVLVADPEGPGAVLQPLIDSWRASHPYPENFDQQGSGDFTAPLVAAQSLELLEEIWGWATIRAYQTELAGYAAELIAAAFAEHTGEDHRVEAGMPVGPMRLVRLPRALAQQDAAALRSRLRAEHQVIAQVSGFSGEGYLRLSAHAYNTPEDYEDFAERVVPQLLAG